MRHISFLLLLLAIIGLISCEKDIETELTLGIVENITPDIEVVDGVVCFKNNESVNVIKNQINGLHKDDLTLWEEKHGFKSLERALNEVEDAIFL